MVENAIRPFAIGKENWLFFCTPKGADASAVFYSLIETAKACGHEAFFYIRHLISEALTFSKYNRGINAADRRGGFVFYIFQH